jgi:hypothetical protein
MGKTLGESELIKRPHQKMTYTKQQLEEFRKCADPLTGPHYFMSNYFYVQHPKKGRMLYRPFSYQVRLIDAYHNFKRIVAMMPRQCGKTVTAAGYLLWSAMFKSDQTILIAAHKFSGASEIMSRIRFGYENVPDFIRAGITEYNKQSIVFDNGSRVIAQTTTETTGRGMSISILYSDEMSSVRPTIAREFWTSCSLTLSTGGKAIVTSTPNNSDDLFADIWHNAKKTEDEYGNTIPNGLGSNGFKAVSAKWNEHPERDEAWADEQRELVGDERFAREILCEFISFDETLINPFVLNQLQGVEPIEKQGTVRWYKKPTKGNIYLLSLDPSIGTGGDPAAIQVFEAKSNQQIAEWTHNKTPIEAQVKLMTDITRYLVSVTENNNGVYWSIENNTLGEAALVEIRHVGEENIPGIFLSEPVKMGAARKFRKGFNTTNSNKLSACAKLKNMIEHNKMPIYSRKLISELKTFVSVENTYRAKPGETDDLVTALITLVRMMEALKNYIPELSEIRELSDDANMPLPFSMSVSSTSYY